MNAPPKSGSAAPRICAICGSHQISTAVVCPRCGSSLYASLLNDSRSKPRKLNSPRQAVGIVFAAAALLVLVITIGSLLFSKPQESEKQVITEVGLEPTPVSPDTAPPAVQRNIGPDEQPPENFSGITVKPFAFVHDPYQNAHQLIRLDYRSIPVVLSGRVLNYSTCPNAPEICSRLSMMGLLFDRMIDPDHALYQVMAIEANSDGTPSKEGELIIDEPSHKGELALSKVWLVEPAEQTEGTNFVGAPVSVPTVKFVRYASWHDLGAAVSPEKQQEEAYSP